MNFHIEYEMQWEKGCGANDFGKVSSKQNFIYNALKTVENNAHYFLNITMNTKLVPGYNSVLHCKQYFELT